MPFHIRVNYHVVPPQYFTVESGNADIIRTNLEYTSQQGSKPEKRESMLGKRPPLFSSPWPLATIHLVAPFLSHFTSARIRHKHSSKKAKPTSF
jgi:hypothetical protein